MIPMRSIRAALLAASCAALAPAALAQSAEGAASWYGPGFHGRTTANGETFDQNALTAGFDHHTSGRSILVVRRLVDQWHSPLPGITAHNGRDGGLLPSRPPIPGVWDVLPMPYEWHHAWPCSC